jgi:hypothetical protein
VAIALSLMADLSVGHIERAFVHQQADHLLVIAKAIGLSWEQKRFWSSERQLKIK